MALTDHLKKSNTRVDKVALAMESMDEEDRTVLAEALDPDSGYQHSDIGKALRAEGYDLTDTQVRHYRYKLKRESND